MTAHDGQSTDFAHLLAYGNSDQASFRSPEVRGSFDLMTVPGTIASFYDEATAAFVLSSQIPYLIDPRTPLFQGVLDAPRASHRTLAKWHGPAVAHHVGEDSVASVDFPVAFWTHQVVKEMVESVLAQQRGYGQKASEVTDKIDRYERLLAEAMALEGEYPPPSVTEGRAPSAELAPYFAVKGEQDPWWSVMQQVWTSCVALDRPQDIRPVLCVGPREGADPADGVDVLGELLPLIPAGLAGSCLFWITGFDERQVSVDLLTRLAAVVGAQGSDRALVNLYGGFFSVCLYHRGLKGFGNGLTYSESRAWPALSSTGAAPARFYVRDLHMFLSQGVAAQVVDAIPEFACPCSACQLNETIAGMPYHDLKKHFALARKWEIETVKASQPGDIAEQMREALAVLDAAQDKLPPKASPDAGHLSRWAKVLDTWVPPPDDSAGAAE